MAFFLNQRPPRRGGHAFRGNATQQQQQNARRSKYHFRKLFFLNRLPHRVVPSVPFVMYDQPHKCGVEKGRGKQQRLDEARASGAAIFVAVGRSPGPTKYARPPKRRKTG